MISMPVYVTLEVCIEILKVINFLYKFHLKKRIYYKNVENKVLSNRVITYTFLDL